MKSPALVRQWTSSLKIMLNYLVADNARNKRSFAIGLLTVYMVVTFLSLIQNALVRSGIVFVKLAEDTTGAFDFIALPDLSKGTLLLNYTSINQSLATTESVAGSAPRWALRANVTNSMVIATNLISKSSATVMIMDSLLEESIGLAPLWPYRPLAQGEVHVTASLLRAIGVQPNSGDKLRLGIDLFEIQNTLGQSASQGSVSTVNGTQNNNSPIPSQSSNAPIVIPVAGLSRQQLVQLDPFLAAGNITRTNNSISIPQSALQTVFGGQSTLQIECTVIDSIIDSSGKYPPSIGNVVIMDRAFAQSLLSADLSQFVTNPLTKILLQTPNLFTSSAPLINLEENAMTVLILLRNRYGIYTMAQADRDAQLVQASNQIATALGLNGPYTLTSVVTIALQASYFIQVFLNEIFFTVVAVLVILAAILITSLLLSDVEDKTFEYGMLRTLGMKQWNLVTLVCMQSLFFSVPGVLVGLMSSYLTFIPIGYFLSAYIGVRADVSMDPGALGLGIFAGLALPLVGMVLPIRRALTKTIRDALDVYHNVVFDTSLNIQRLEEWGLNMNEVIVSVLLVVIGFMVYYLIPLSFIFGRLDLFFRMMTIILLGMVIGQVLLSQALSGIMERLAVYVTTFVCSDRDLSQIVVKNLASHSGRNQKTSIMFTLCMGYILFAGTMFALQAESLNQNVEWFYGADVSIVGPGMNKPLPESKLRKFLDQNSVANNGVVETYAFTTYSLNTYFALNAATAGRLASIKSPSVSIFGLEKNYLNATKNVYAVPSEISPNVDLDKTVDGSPDLVNALYRTTDLSIKAPPSVLSQSATMPTSYGVGNASVVYSFPVYVLMSEALRDKAAIDASHPVLLTLDYRISSTATAVKKFFATPVAMMRKFPGFPKVIRLQTSKSPLFVSMDSYYQMLNAMQTDVKTNASSVPYPKGQCFVRLNSGASALEVEALINSLNSLLEDSDFVTTGLQSQIDKTSSAAAIINIIFNIVALVGIVLSFFVLLLSFVANIRENSWEIGVIRAVGLNASKVTRVYIHEAVSIIIACMILGTILGIFTASTLTLQSNLFSEMPFTFNFPISLFVLVILSALSLAVLGSYYPITDFIQKPIAITLRGG